MQPSNSTDRNLLIFSPIDWDEVWEGPQEITTHFANAGWRVLFVENIGARVPRLSLSDARRIRVRVTRLLTKSMPHTPVPAGITVHTPTQLPSYKGLHRTNRDMLVGQIRSQLKVLGMNRPIIWTYNPSTLIREVCTALSPQLLVYCCVHDYSTISPQHARLVEEEEQMLDAAGLVLVLSQQLFAEKQQNRTHVHLLPQGANLQDYLKFSAGGDIELETLPHPLIGYIGTIHEWFDQRLLQFVAQARPDWNFVLIGPERVKTSGLRKLKNVIFLGPKAHADLPGYVAQFDVGIIPYSNTPFARTIRPNKVLEYLVMGKPVVTTHLPELAVFQNHLLSTESPQQFIEAIELALATDSPGKRLQRREVAIANSMDRKFKEIEALVLGRVNLEHTEPVHRSYQ